MKEKHAQLHRRRQGMILLLLLLGPAPIAMILFLVGTSTAAVTAILAATAALIAWMLALYARQRKLAPKADLPVLPASQVIGMLVILGCVAGGVFLLPNPQTAGYGAACLGLATVIIYRMGASLRRTLEHPDERSAVLVLALMAVMIAFGAAFV